MFSLAKTEHTLEIAGPRKQGWRPAGSAHGELLREAVTLASLGRIAEAIERAEDLWIAQHGHMHGVSFRVRQTCETFHAKSLRSVQEETQENA